MFFSSTRNTQLLLEVCVRAWSDTSQIMPSFPVTALAASCVALAATPSSLVSAFVVPSAPRGLSAAGPVSDALAKNTVGRRSHVLMR